MKQKILLILLATMLLVLSACEGDPSGPATDSGFVGGTKGLEIKFLDGSPPDFVNDGGQDPFYVTVTLKNQGEHDVEPEDAVVKLKGFSATDFGITNEDLITNPPETLSGKYKIGEDTIIDSPLVYVDFPQLNYQDTLIGGHYFPFTAEICYNYQTIATSDLCIKENYNTQDPSDLCVVTGPRRVSNSGAPIQITNVRQAPERQDRTIITFSVKNLGGGEVFRPDFGCDFQIPTAKERVFISVSGLTQGPQDLVECRGLREGDSSSGYILLSGAETQEVSCSIRLEDRSPRVQPFQITAAYDYFDYVRKDVQVRHSPI